MEMAFAVIFSGRLIGSNRYNFRKSITSITCSEDIRLKFLLLFFIVSYGHVHEKIDLMSEAKNKGPRSAFAPKHSDQDLFLTVDIFYGIQRFGKRTMKALISLRMRRQIWAFVVRICVKGPFRMLRPI